MDRTIEPDGRTPASWPVIEARLEIRRILKFNKL
jgi:hypothetical protein